MVYTFRQKTLSDYEITIKDKHFIKEYRMAKRLGYALISVSFINDGEVSSIYMEKLLKDKNIYIRISDHQTYNKYTDNSFSTFILDKELPDNSAKLKKFIRRLEKRLTKRIS